MSLALRAEGATGSTGSPNSSTSSPGTTQTACVSADRYSVVVVIAAAVAAVTGIALAAVAVRWEYRDKHIETPPIPRHVVAGVVVGFGTYVGMRTTPRASVGLAGAGVVAAAYWLVVFRRAVAAVAERGAFAAFVLLLYGALCAVGVAVVAVGARWLFAWRHVTLDRAARIAMAVAPLTGLALRRFGNRAAKSVAGSVTDAEAIAYEINHGPFSR